MSIHSPRPPTLNKARYVVRRAVEQLDTIEGRNDELRQFKPKSEKGVRDAFNSYRSVCHFWAAQRADVKLFVSIPESGDALREFLALSAAFESRLDHILGQDEWGPWRVPNELRRSDFAVRVPPLSPENDAYLREYHPALR